MCIRDRGIGDYTAGAVASIAWNKPYAAVDGNVLRVVTRDVYKRQDWRNREKWDLYEEAVNEMLQKTNTAYAPWHILESNDKKYARIKALKTVIEAIEKKME